MLIRTYVSEKEHIHMGKLICCRSSSLSSPSSPTTSNSSPSSPSFLAFDTDFPIRGCPHQTGTSDPKASLDTKALAEASRNLTQTLKQLSSEVLTTKPSPEKETVKQPVPDRRSTPERNTYTTSPNFSGKSRRQGAIIESMHHHGKGVYSGTFSGHCIFTGTLNPALQDRQGRPKRDISTIIHILNDLLCATPQYRRHSSSTTSSSSSSTSSAGSTSSSSSNASQNNVHNNQSKSQSNAGTSSTTTTTTQVLGVSTTIGTTSDEESSTDDNQVTRTKLEHLRFIMEQRRARRKARREARASPYAAHSSTTTSWSSETTTLVASKSTSANNSSRGEGGTQGLDVEGKEKEGNDSAALCELNTGTVVA
ncbi:Midnolin-B [Armadillidium vulgare]|nr:Midnolin-B [Armadillidium vulgare]